jgi:hypothetical protein
VPSGGPFASVDTLKHHCKSDAKNSRTRGLSPGAISRTDGRHNRVTFDLVTLRLSGQGKVDYPSVDLGYLMGLD